MGDNKYDSGRFDCIPSDSNSNPTSTTTISTTAKKPAGCIRENTGPAFEHFSNINRIDDTADTARKCRDTCGTEDNSCKFWSFDQNDSKCYLLNSNSSIIEGDKPDFMLGTVRCDPVSDKEEDYADASVASAACIKKDTGHLPHNFGKDDDGAKTAEKCQENCQAVDECKFWSFYNDKQKCYFLVNDDGIKVGAYPNYTFGGKYCKPE